MQILGPGAHKHVALDSWVPPMGVAEPRPAVAHSACLRKSNHVTNHLPILSWQPLSERGPDNDYSYEAKITELAGRRSRVAASFVAP